MTYKRILVISDLHFEKGSFFSQSNQFIPPFDTIETLRQLNKFINNNEVKTIIFLGDLIHDKLAFKRMATKPKELFFEIVKNIECILTVGNHDDKSFLLDIGLNLTDRIIIDGVCFSHLPLHDKEYSIFGHFHPKVSIKIE